MDRLFYSFIIFNTCSSSSSSSRIAAEMSQTPQRQVHVIVMMLCAVEATYASRRRLRTADAVSAAAARVTLLGVHCVHGIGILDLFNKYTVNIHIQF